MSKIVFAYPEEHSPPEFSLQGSFVVVGTTPKYWSNFIQGPSLEQGYYPVAKFLSSLGPRIIPLSEEAVVVAALAEPQRTTGTISCTYRKEQATKLGDLSPTWWLVHEPPLAPFPWWFKAPASDSSRGVERVENLKTLEETIRRTHTNAYTNITGLKHLVSNPCVGILQEHVPGPQFEISGVVGEPGCELWFEPLLQHWEGFFIQQYEPAPQQKPELERLGSEVVRRLGLAWCFVCVEARQGPHGWRVIEAHCRPGDDPLKKGYPTTPLLQGIEQLVRWHEEKHRDPLDFLVEEG